jgi:hypothetical protein
VSAGKSRCQFLQYRAGDRCRFDLDQHLAGGARQAMALDHRRHGRCIGGFCQQAQAARVR